MRKFLIIILSLITLSANAQIKDTILNSTLGRSSQQNVLKTIQANEYAFTETSETIACSDVEFAGYGWEKVVFYFYKQVLYKVVFESPYVISEKEIKSWNRPTKRSDIMKAIREAANFIILYVLLEVNRLLVFSGWSNKVGFWINFENDV